MRCLSANNTADGYHRIKPTALAELHRSETQLKRTRNIVNFYVFWFYAFFFQNFFCPISEIKSHKIIPLRNHNADGKIIGICYLERLIIRKVYCRHFILFLFKNVLPFLCTHQMRHHHSPDISLLSL